MHPQACGGVTVKTRGSAGPSYTIGQVLQVVTGALLATLTQSFAYRHQAHLRQWGRGLLSRQGSDGFEPRTAAHCPWPPGDDAEARPVPQRRSGHHEPVPAR
ncbi:hypothetical protein RHCRD62_20767 [Rhodococcus sp. RD6.2]|nr:hypothetical protein RHCRD62_20767 [Rhodococcus sp. RD6.2]